MNSEVAWRLTQVPRDQVIRRAELIDDVCTGSPQVTVRMCVGTYRHESAFSHLAQLGPIERTRSQGISVRRTNRTGGHIQRKRNSLSNIIGYALLNVSA